MTALACSPDGANVAIGTADGSAGLWSVRTADRLVAYPGSTSSVSAIAFARDGTQLATASADGTTKVWNAAGPQSSSLDAGGAIDEVRLDGNRVTATVGTDGVRSWLLDGAQARPSSSRRLGAGSSTGCCSARTARSRSSALRAVGGPIGFGDRGR